MLVKDIAHKVIIRKAVNKLHNAITLSGTTINREKVEDYVLLGFPPSHEVASILKRNKLLDEVAQKLTQPCQKITKFLLNPIAKTSHSAQKFFNWKRVFYSLNQKN